MDTDMEHPVATSPNGAGHEHREVDVRFIVVSLIVLLIGAFLVCLLTIGIFRYFHNEYLPAQVTYLQLQNLRALEDHVLSSYAWVDQNAGTVRIPIDQAIDMVAQKGLPSHDYLADITKGSSNAKQ